MIERALRQSAKRVFRYIFSSHRVHGYAILLKIVYFSNYPSSFFNAIKQSKVFHIIVYKQIEILVVHISPLTFFTIIPRYT